MKATGMTKTFVWKEFRKMPRKAMIVIEERMRKLVGDQVGMSNYILHHSGTFLSPYIIWIN